ncbi:putative transcription factor C2C2-CO-like family [Helianthus annuus]|nr:putative transcription factor C2C2-CO-like family [Helianthus annuus]
MKGTSTKKSSTHAGKRLADSRPRVRGRFAKHDEFGENNITNSNHEEDTDEDEQNVHEVVRKKRILNHQTSWHI